MLGLAKYMPQTNAYCFRKVNSLITACGLKPLKEYKLLSKTENINISFIDKNQYWQVPKDSVTFSHVVIGKKSDTSYTKEVMSFFDENQKPIAKMYRENGVFTKLRRYFYDGNKRIIECSNFDISRIDEGITEKNFLNLGGIWKKQSKEIQKIKEFPIMAVEESAKQRTAKQLFSQKIEYLDENNTRRITYTQHPLNMGFNSKGKKKKFISGVIKNEEYNVSLSDIKQSDNLHLNTTDEFLTFRFLNPHTEEGIIALTKEFLRRNCLEKMNIRIIPNCNRVKTHSEGFFSASKSEICYAKGLLSKYVLHIVDTVAHEVEHAWQHWMIGRIGRGKTAYETRAMELFGFLPQQHLEEANKLAIAREKYPIIKDGETFSKNPAYKNNYMEVQANEAGKYAAIDYSQDTENFNFFEQFV